MVFFTFAVHCCFMAILKTSADTNQEQSYRLSHCIKNPHHYNLKSFGGFGLSKHLIDNTPLPASVAWFSRVKFLLGVFSFVS